MVGSAGRSEVIRLQPLSGVVMGLTAAFICGGVVAILTSSGHVAWGLLVVSFPLIGALAISRIPFHPAAVPFILALPLGLTAGLAWGQAISFAFLLATLVMVRNPPAITPRLRTGVLLGSAAIFLGLLIGLLNRNDLFLLVGDVAQYIAFYLAVLVAFRQRINVTSPLTLAFLGAAVVITLITDIAMGHIVFRDVLGDIARHIDFVAGFVFIWAVACSLWRRRSLVGLAVAATSGVSVVLSFTRGLWLGTFLGALVVMVFYVARAIDSRKARRILAFIGLLLIIAPALAVTSEELSLAVTHRVLSIVNLQQDPDWQRRQLETSMALQQLDSPVLGRGLGATYIGPSGFDYLQIGELHFLHNQYVAMVVRIGLLGLTLVGLSLWVLRPRSTSTAQTAAALGTITFALVTGISSPMLFTYPMNLFVGLAVGAALASYPKSPSLRSIEA